MLKQTYLLATALSVAALLAGSATAHDSRRSKDIEVFARLKSVNEVPTLSTTGTGTLRARIDTEAQTIEFELNYADLEGGAVQQAHIHLGQRHTTGAVIVFFCTNLGNNAAAPPCPASAGTVKGTLTAADIGGGGAAAGLPAGAFDELVGLLRSGNMYANVHTETFPAGEIRGQVHQIDR
jgi:hypothetical protein